VDDAFALERHERLGGDRQVEVLEGDLGVGRAQHR
jgi:hypothetical protein